jgi:hypothetical protein
MLLLECNIQITRISPEITSNQKVTFQLVNEIDIHSSYEVLTDTCRITLPKGTLFLSEEVSGPIESLGKFTRIVQRSPFAGREPVVTSDIKSNSLIPNTTTNNNAFVNVTEMSMESLFTRGDFIQVFLNYSHGYSDLDHNYEYDSGPKLAFEGYVTKYDYASPIVIECEDAMFFYKNSSIPLYPSKIRKLNEVIEDIYTNKYSKGGSRLYKQLGNINEPANRLEKNLDVNVGKIGFGEEIMVSDIFEYLRSNLGIFTYFRLMDKNEKGCKIEGPQLYSGMPSDASTGKTVNLTFEQHIIDFSNLKWQESSDMNLKVKVVNMNFDNTKSTVYITYDGVGTVINGKLEHFKVSPKGKIDKSSLDTFKTLKTVYTSGLDYDAMIKVGKERFFKLNYTGYKGSFETFGEPYIRHGDKVDLRSWAYLNMSGVYTVISVNRKFGVNGYRQIVEIGVKVGESLQDK